MATNEILQFAETDTGTNLLTQAEYLADAQRPIGNQPGVARSKLVNKALRQSSLIAAAVAQFIADNQANNVVDTATSTDIADWIEAAVRSIGIPTAAAGGTADAITADFTPNVALTNGTTVIVRAGAANTTTTPTFAPDGLTAKTIVKGNNLALAAGDIAGAGHWLEMNFDSVLDKWVLQNPARGVTSSVVYREIQPVSASVAANALTVTLNPTALDFRSNSLTNGAINTRSIASAISLTISSGSTLGTINNVASRIAILAIDNNGTVELAAVNMAGGVNLDETTLVNTTAEGGAGAADSSTVIYSQTARTGVPFRVVGYVESTQATAGTWVSAPTLIQGYGGQAMAAMQSLGFGQTWQNVSGSRALNTTYYNTTGRPILVTLNSTLVQNPGFTFTVNGAAVQAMGINQPGGATASPSQTCLIPPGASYSVSIYSNGAVASWYELR